MTRAQTPKFATTWLLFWEGALITHFFGLLIAAAWFVGFALIAVGVHIGLRHRAAARV